MSKEELFCPICGEPTYLVYGKNPRKDKLCWKHSQMLFNGEIIANEDGTFTDIKTKKFLNKIDKISGGLYFRQRITN